MEEDTELRWVNGVTEGLAVVEIEELKQEEVEVWTDVTVDRWVGLGLARKLREAPGKPGACSHTLDRLNVINDFFKGKKRVDRREQKQPGVEACTWTRYRRWQMGVVLAWEEYERIALDSQGVI